MELVAAFAGLLVGWFLGLGRDLWHERRRARFAARVIEGELVGNLVTAERISNHAQWDDVESDPLHDDAWKAHAATLLPIASEADVERLVIGYHAIRSFTAVARQAKRVPWETITDTERKRLSGNADLHIEAIDGARLTAFRLGWPRSVPEPR